jgi:iron complex transport system substrate-binding protein
MPRPIAITLTLALLSAGTLAGCGADTQPPLATTQSAGAFPVTVTHKYGSTEITAPPTRVVAAGYRDQEYLLALGVVPVGIRDWYGPDYPYEKWPWVAPALGTNRPTVHSGFDSINLEKVAALRPDLITTVYSDTPKDVYDKLSRIAPTVAQGAGAEDFTMSWQDETRLIGAALGRTGQADALVTRTEKLSSDAAAAHPEFAGKRIAVLQFGDQGKFYVLHPTDPKTRFFTDLGFTVPAALASVVGKESNKEVSIERLDLLAGLDAVVWLSGTDAETRRLQAAMQADKLYQGLPSVRAGHDLFLVDGSDALAWGSPLSLPYALRQIVPQLVTTVAGRP